MNGLDGYRLKNLLCIAHFGWKKMRVLGNVIVNCALNWDYWDYFWSVSCAHVCCMILYCLA